MSTEPGFYLCIDSIGGGTGAVDKLKGAPLQDKEAILAFIGTEFKPYHLDDDSGAAENDPLVISPDEDAGDKRWILSSGVFAGLTLYGNITMPDGGTIGKAAGATLGFGDYIASKSASVSYGLILRSQADDGYYASIGAANGYASYGYNNIIGTNSLKIDVDGNVDIAGVHKVDGVQVVGNQGAAVADATDPATTMARLNDLLARCRAHGLIAT